MDAPPPVSPEVLAALPAEVLALIQWLTARVAKLEAEVAEHKARLNKDSTNSSLPPSSSHPHAKPAVRPENVILAVGTTRVCHSGSSEREWN